MSQLLDDVMRAMRSAVARSIEPLARQLTAVSERLQAVEARQPERGPVGERGADGAPGERGADGAPGERGPAGESIVGPQGPAGPQGERGEPGPRGEDGATPSSEQLALLVEEHLRAFPAPAGPQGPSGPAGERGPAGESIVGPAGPQGPQGERGEPAGIDQIRGLIRDELAENPPPAGPQGPAGPPGERGADVSEEQALALVERVFGEYVDALPEPEPGPPGPRGEKGEPGPAGADGADGRDGQRGEPGRDATQIDILGGIDAQRRYQRGTFATWRGGLIHAFRATDPIGEGEDIGRAGWQVVVEGTADMEIAFDGERSISVTSILTSGERQTKSFAMPAVIDRGVWRERSYEAGDGVTWARHYWIAKRQTTAKPEPGDDWRLAVKGGRDGNDAPAAAPGATIEQLRDSILRDFQTRGPLWRALEQDLPMPRP